MPFGHQLGQAIDAKEVGQEVAQGLVVEQGARTGAAPTGQGPAQGEEGQPLRPAADDAQGVGVVDLLGPKIAPDLNHGPHGEVVVIGAARQGQAVDRPRRGATDDLERVAAARLTGIAADVLQGLEHTHLVGGAGAPPSEDQCGFAWQTHEGLSAS